MFRLFVSINMTLLGERFTTLITGKHFFKEKATQISFIYFVLSSPGPLASLLRNTYKNKLSKFLQINKAPAQGSMPDHHYSLDHSPIPSFSGQE